MTKRCGSAPPSPHPSPPAPPLQEEHCDDAELPKDTKTSKRRLGALARTAELRTGLFKPQNLANTAWAFATMRHSDEELCEALARAAEQRVGYFNVQELANTA